MLSANLRWTCAQHAASLDCRAPPKGVCAHRIADDGTLVVLAEQFEEGRLGFVVFDSMHHDAGRREAPHLKGRAFLVRQPFPAGLIEAHHGLGNHMRAQCLVHGLKIPREHFELLPERLTRHLQTVAL